MGRKLMVWLAGLALILGLGLFALRTPDTNRAAMVAKYGGAEAHFIDSPVGRIHYRDQGPRGAPVLLLIHGSNSALQTWDAVTAGLKDRYRIVAFDMPGHGLTGVNPQGDYTVSTALRAATAVLDAVGVKQAVWVGNSAGGRVAWHAALNRPDRVSGMVLVDSSGARTNEPLKLYLGAKLARTWLGRQLLPVITPRGLVAASLKQNYADPTRITDATIDRYWELTRFPGNRIAAGRWAQNPIDDGEWDNIGRIAVPTLLIWGRQDKVVPQSHAEAFAAAIEGSQLHFVEDAGHLPMEERPDAFIEVLGPWLEQHASPQPHGRTDQPS